MWRSLRSVSSLVMAAGGKGRERERESRTKHIYRAITRMSVQIEQDACNAIIDAIAYPHASKNYNTCTRRLLRFLVARTTLWWALHPPLAWSNRSDLHAIMPSAPL